jgi:hypothetical protein
MPYREAYGMEFSDLARRVPDLARVARRIGFAPRRDLDSIVVELVQLAREERAGPCGAEASSSGPPRREHGTGA